MPVYEPPVYEPPNPNDPDPPIYQPRPILPPDSPNRQQPTDGNFSKNIFRGFMNLFSRTDSAAMTAQTARPGGRLPSIDLQDPDFTVLPINQDDPLPDDDLPDIDHPVKPDPDDPGPDDETDDQDDPDDEDNEDNEDNEGNEDEEDNDEEEEEDKEEFERVVAEGGYVPNCVPCDGQECRCPGPDCFTLPSRERRDEPSPLPERDEKVYPSFYRGYEAVTERDSIENISVDEDAGDWTEDSDDTDVLRSTVSDVACYGFYQEFDPKTTMTAGTRNDDQPGDSARRCVIAFDYSREELLRAQSVILRTAPDLDEDEFDEEDSEQTLQYREPTDAWYPLLGGMSFLRESSDMDLGSAFLHLDDATMHAAARMANAAPTNIHGGDETVSNQTGAAQYFLTWLHALQDEMARLLSPPEVRMRVPASWLPDLPPDTELIAVNIDVDEETDAFDPRHASIDVRTRAGEDLQGIFLKELEKTFAIRELVVPAVIPAGSRYEFQNRAQQWKDSIRRREMLGLSYPSEMWMIAGDLERYGEQIERYQGLRAQLQETAMQLVSDRENDLSAMAEWMEDTVNRYRTFDAERSRRLDMAPLVREVQAEIARFDDDVNAQWCKNDGFTTPIYSLLHKWYPGSPKLRPPTSCDGADGTLPLLCMPHERSMLIDFSTLVTSTEPLYIPVLHPIQILPDLPPLPDDNDPDPQVFDSLPDMPPVPRIDITAIGRAGAIDLGKLPDPIAFPQPLNAQSMESALARARELLRGRNEAYDEFWKSLEPPEPSFWEFIGWDDGDDGGEKSRLACEGWNMTPCVHVEMDLIERLTRITAMPGVHLREHLLVQGRPRLPSTTQLTDEATMRMTAVCDPQNDVCSPPLHRTIVDPTVGFQVASPEMDEVWNRSIDDIRRSAREITIDRNGRETENVDGQIFPFVGEPEDLYDSFTVPSDTELLQ